MLAGTVRWRQLFSDFLISPCAGHEDGGPDVLQPEANILGTPALQMSRPLEGSPIWDRRRWLNVEQAMRTTEKCHYGTLVCVRDTAPRGEAMQEPLPSSISAFEEKHPVVWEAFAKLGEACHETGPLDEKTRRLVKLAMALGLRHEGAVHSATRNALQSGVTREEIEHVAILAITTMGWPSAYAAMTWIEDEISHRDGSK